MKEFWVIVSPRGVPVEGTNAKKKCDAWQLALAGELWDYGDRQLHQIKLESKGYRAVCGDWKERKQ